MFGFLPTATSSSAPVAVDPSSIVTVTSPSRATETARQFVRTSTPASRSAASTSAEANGSSRTITRGAPSSRTNCRPERRPRLRQFDADDAATEDHERLRGRLGGGRLTVPPWFRLDQARDRRHDRPTPGRDDDGLRCDQHVLADRDAPLAVELRVAAHKLDTALLQPRHVAGVVQVVDHLVAPREHGRHVEPVGVNAGNALRLGKQITGAEQRLRGHARVEGALAADEVLLDERDREPALTEPPGSDLAGRAGADDDDVEAAFGHASSVADARYATIAA